MYVAILSDSKLSPKTFEKFSKYSDLIIEIVQSRHFNYYGCMLSQRLQQTFDL